VIGQYCNCQGINSMVEISWDIFRNLVDCRLRHLVNKVAIHVYIYDYIRMEITVLYLKFHGINCRLNGRKYPFTGDASYRVASKLNLRPSNLQLMPWNFQIQYSYLLNVHVYQLPIYFQVHHINTIPLHRAHKQVFGIHYGLMFSTGISSSNDILICWTLTGWVNSQ
jgi:hypothetical protein